MSIDLMRSTLVYLKAFYVWPEQAKELKAPKTFYIKFVVMIVGCLLPLIGAISHIIVASIIRKFVRYLLNYAQVMYVSLDKDYQIFLEVLATIISLIGTTYFICVFVPFQRDISQMLVQFSTFEVYGKPFLFDERDKRLTFLSRIYKYYIDGVVIAFLSSAFLNKRICESANTQRDFQDYCGYVVAIWLPFNLNKMTWKVPLIAWQTFAMYMMHQGASLSSFLMMGVMEHLIVRIKHLKSLLVEAINTDDKNLRERKFMSCVEYHIDIFRLGQECDRCFKACLFVHTIITGLIFGICGYSLITGITANQIGLIVGWFVASSIVNVKAQHLLDESMSVEKAILNTRWYERDVAFQKDILFMILRSQKPITVHAGPFSNLSYVLILSILKAGYSYITLLQATST